MRDSHLAGITVPVLFCSGTRDAFASPDELRTAAARSPYSSVDLLEEADHGFNVPKSSGRTRRQIWEEAIEVLLSWLRAQS